MHPRGFPSGSGDKESAYNAGNLGSTPGSGRSAGEEIQYPLQYSCLEDSMDREAWWATVHGIAKSCTQLSNITFFLAGCLGPHNFSPRALTLTQDTNGREE